MHLEGAHLDELFCDADIDLASTNGRQAGSMLGWAEGTRDSVADDLTLPGRSASSRTIRRHKVGALDRTLLHTAPGCCCPSPAVQRHCGCGSWRFSTRLQNTMSQKSLQAFSLMTILCWCVR